MTSLAVMKRTARQGEHWNNGEKGSSKSTRSPEGGRQLKRCRRQLFGEERKLIMNSFESYFDVDHREQAKRKQQNCLLKSRECQTGRSGRTGQTICRGISSFAVGMIIGWMAGTITYCMIHIITK